MNGSKYITQLISLSGGWWDLISVTIQLVFNILSGSSYSALT